MITPAPDPATVLDFVPVPPSASSVARPVGFGGRPGPRSGVGIGQLELKSGLGDADSSAFKPRPVDVGKLADKNHVPSSEMSAGYTFAHLAGSALSGAFSKALMRSTLPAAEKARILTEVTSIADLELKERARRDWLSKLQN